jgi:cytoskeletal protein CcmA (bactofilin family)
MIWKKSESEEVPAREHAPQMPQPAPATRIQQPQARERAMIGPTIEIKGNLSGAEDLFIEGRLDGKIDLSQNSVTVGKNGRVRADIVGRSIIVMGEVEGNLYGEEQIVLHQASRVCGNLFAPRVTLEDGSQFKGSIDMTVRNSADPDSARLTAPDLRPLPVGPQEN